MSNSNGVAAIRWVLLGLLVIAAAAVIYVIVLTSDVAGFTVGTIPGSFVVSAGSACLVFVVGLGVMLRRSKPIGGVEERLDRMSTPAVPPASNTEPRQTGIGEAVETPDSVSKTGATPPESDSAVGDESIPAAMPERGSGQSDQREVVAEKPEPPTASAADSRLAAAEPARFERWNSARSAPTAWRHGHLPTRTSGMSTDTTGSDAVRLAAMLNRYEHTGVPAGRRSDIGEQRLWTDLVDGYGAASIDLNDDDPERCVITLESGDLVFYLPEHKRWMWLIFDRADVAPTPATPPPVAPAAEDASLRIDRLARLYKESADRQPPAGSRRTMVAGMAPILSSQNTPAAYEEALFVTEGLLLGAAYGKRVVPYEELVWVVEAATGHVLHLQSMGRFLGDLVERTYPRHMDVLSALAVPASAASPTVNSEDSTSVDETRSSVIDLTDTEPRPHQQAVGGRSS